jgi:DNA-binding MarR family transcriptional regulator
MRGPAAREQDDADRRRTIVRLHDDYRAKIASWRLSPRALRATLETLPQEARAGFWRGGGCCT